MPKCIYCQENKDSDHFRSVEHVIPQSFGRFENNLTLINKVCDTCNGYFGKHLDLHLARDTMEGRARVFHGVIEPEDFRSSRNSRITVKVKEGPYKGAYVYQDYLPETDTVGIKPCPQVGFLMHSGDYEYYLLDQIPTKTKLLEEGYNPSTTRSVRSIGVDPNEAKIKLAEKHINFENQTNINDPPSESGKLLCEIQTTVDQIIFRAISKIAFNYLAYFHDVAFLNHPSFDVMRRFIRYADAPPYEVVQAKEDAILEDETIEGKRVLGHLITVNWAIDTNSIVSQIALFNYMTYCVSLAQEYSGERPDIKRGHLFNIGNRKLLELGTRSAGQ